MVAHASSEPQWRGRECEWPQICVAGFKLLCCLSAPFLSTLTCLRVWVSVPLALIPMGSEMAPSELTAAVLCLCGDGRAPRQHRALPGQWCWHVPSVFLQPGQRLATVASVGGINRKCVWTSLALYSGFPVTIPVLPFWVSFVLSVCLTEFSFSLAHHPTLRWFGK